jgi:PAS domain S-box-containing protein
MTADDFLALSGFFPEALLLLTPGGTVRAANPGAGRLFGSDPVALVGRPLADLVLDPPEAVAALIRAWSRSANRLPGSLIVANPGGQPTSCRCDGAFLPDAADAQGRLLLLRLVAREEAASGFLALRQKVDELSAEIARRRQAEEDLRRQREWLGVTLTSIGDAVLATDEAGRVVFLNQAAEDLTGWTTDEAAGRDVEEVFRIVSELTREPADSPVTRALREGARVGLANHTALVRRDGSECPIADCAAPIRADDGRILGAVLVFHDVSDRRMLERELRERADRLARADRRKDTFLAMLAHELRNPLAPLLTGVETLRRAGSDPAVLEPIRRSMDRQVRHLTRVVEDLLDVSRLTRGQLRLQPRRLDVAQLARDTAEDYRPSFVEAGHELRVEVPEVPVPANGDPTRLAQVLVNLLDNACKFTPAGGTVTVTVAADPTARRCWLTVADTGAGIDAAVLAELFEPFSQADFGYDRPHGGLGLGLALIRGLARLHGGDADAASPGAGRGATFRVWLPLADEPPALSRPGSNPPEMIVAPLRVLVIDDNRDVADSLRLFLELLGHEVVVAYSGPEGVDLARSARPAVVLCDLGLPGLDGFGVARALRADPLTATARLIAVSGWAAEDDRRRSQEAGFDAHLAKPADPDALLHLLR